MTLDDYLSLPGNTATALAERAGTTGASIARIRRGEQNLSASLIRAIVEATDGAVTAHDLVFVTQQTSDDSEAVAATPAQERAA